MSGEYDYEREPLPNMQNALRIFAHLKTLAPPDHLLARESPEFQVNYNVRLFLSFSSRCWREGKLMRWFGARTGLCDVQVGWRDGIL
jgi:hypothetical protein